ncbi:rhomboid family intramembrane serine protease [Puniceicoccaceae bacterium K14]|nr:rhomboid family intramembrane serine protease [Puniceicoccaceae bacterium K14]
MIHDRSYMSSNYGKSPANALTWIIGINVGVFIIQCLEYALSTSFVADLFELSRSGLGKGFVWTVLSYSVLHSTEFLRPGGGLLPWHILGNMYLTFMLGRALLPTLGTQRFVQLYVGAALTGGLFWFASTFISADPNAANSALIGASGSVFGLLALFACLYPNQEIQILLFFVVPVKVKPKIVALVLLGASAVLFIATELTSQGSRIAHSAHLGGMLGGWLFYRYIYMRNVNFDFSFRLPNFFKKKPSSKKPGSGYNYTINVKQESKTLQKEVDRILDKINSKGFASLTQEEKHTLDQARDLLNKR